MPSLPLTRMPGSVDHMELDAQLIKINALTAADFAITDSGSKFTGTTIEAALQECAAAATIDIADSGNKFTGTTVEAALQECADAGTIDITDSGNKFTGTTVEAALQECADAATIDITDSGNKFTGTTVEAALQECADAATIDITDAALNFTATTVEAALAELYGHLGYCVLTIGGNTYRQPISMLEVGTPAEITCADTDHDDVTLGTTIVMTGNVVQALLADIASATIGQRTCVMNASSGTGLVTVADETNTKINGQGKRLSLAAGGWVVLEETANDRFIIVQGKGVSLVAFSS